MEGLDNWEQHACRAYELFEKHGNRAIMIEELATVLFHYPLISNLVFYANGEAWYLSIVTKCYSKSLKKEINSACARHELSERTLFLLM